MRKLQGQDFKGAGSSCDATAPDDACYHPDSGFCACLGRIGELSATDRILVWLSMVLATALGRGLLYLQFRKARDDAFNGEYWQNLYLTLTLAAGVAWGASAFIIFPPINHPDLIFLFLLVIACLSVTTTVCHSSLRFAPVAWTGPVVIAYALRCSTEGGGYGYTISMLGLLFLSAVIIFGLKHNGFISSGIVLRFENLELIETLEESEEKFRLAFRTSPDSINLNRLSDGMYIDINEGFTKLSGYTRDDVLGKTSIELDIWPDPKDRARLRADIESNGFVDNLEAEFHAKDGRILTGLMSARLLRINQEDMVLSITRDITARKKTEAEKKKLEAELFFAQRMESVGRLAGGVAHDFNNMLSVIIGRAEIALRSGDLNDRLRQNLNEIINAGQRSADLTRQLLTFASKQPATPKITDLNETISGTLVMLRRVIGEDINLSWAPGRDLLKIRIDPSQIDQILVNLVANARDSISSAGSITVRTDNFV